MALCIKNENREEKEGEILEKNDAIDELLLQQQHT